MAQLDAISEASDEVSSPCIGVCVLGAEAWCLGCGRDTKEIMDWASKSQDEQRLICQRAEQRIVDSGGRIAGLEND